MVASPGSPRKATTASRADWTSDKDLRDDQQCDAGSSDRPGRRRREPGKRSEPGRRSRRRRAGKPSPAGSGERRASRWPRASSRCRSARCPGRRRRGGNCGEPGIVPAIGVSPASRRHDAPFSRLRRSKSCYAASGYSASFKVIVSVTFLVTFASGGRPPVRACASGPTR